MICEMLRTNMTNACRLERTPAATGSERVDPATSSRWFTTGSNTETCS